MTNRNPAAGGVPVCLVYVADNEKRLATPTGGPPPGAPRTGTSGNPPAGARPSFGEVDVGFIGQNVYLFYASEGLAVWFYGTDREGLARAMN